MTIITGTASFQQMTKNELWEVVNMGGKNYIIPITKLSSDSLLSIPTGSIVNTSPVYAGTLSILNSTTTPLASGSAFTGTWQDVTQYSSIIVAPKTDQNGYYLIQFSPDGINTDSSLIRYYRTNSIEPPHRFSKTRQYARIIFVNTGNDQTYLRLQTILGDIHPLNVPGDAVMSQDYDSTSVRPSKFEYEVALGLRQGATTWNKFGYNGDVDVGTEVLAVFGGTFTPLLTGTRLSISSTSTDDNGYTSGSGCRAIVVYGIDQNRVSQTEVVTLSGTASVLTAGQWLGVNRSAIYLAGSGLGNAGVITMTAVSDGSVQAQIGVGEGTTQQCIFFTQKDHQALIDWLIVDGEKLSGGTTPKFTFKAWVYSAVSNAKYEIFRQVVDTTVDDHIELRPSQPFVVGEKSCFWIEVTTDQNNSIATGRFSLIEFRDFDA